MPPSEILKKECEEITQKTGIYIPPYRLSNLLKTASKVFDLISKSDICMNYHECLITLRIVMNCIKEITGEEA